MDLFARGAHTTKIYPQGRCARPVVAAGVVDPAAPSRRWAVLGKLWYARIDRRFEVQGSRNQGLSIDILYKGVTPLPPFPFFFTLNSSSLVIKSIKKTMCFLYRKKTPQFQKSRPEESKLRQKVPKIDKKCSQNRLPIQLFRESWISWKSIPLSI